MTEPVDKITLEELQRRLLDPDVDRDEIAPYFIVDRERSKPFDPVLKIDTTTVIIAETDSDGTRSALIMNSANWLAKSLRQRRFHRRLSDPDYRGPVVVDEGDSWFQYPILLDDTVDVLMEDLAVFSLSAGGDTIKNMADKAEYRSALAETGASVLLVSAGGNDMVANGDLAKHLRRFQRSLAPNQYLLRSFDQLLGQALASYDRIFADVTARFPRVEVITHGYDRPIPNGGGWIGEPMASRGIEDRDLQAEIAGLMIDRFNERLATLVARYPKVHYLDMRGVVDGRWHDELHPTDAGYRDVAERFRHKIDEVTGSGRPPAGVEGGATAAGWPGLASERDEPHRIPKGVSLHVGINEVDPDHYGSTMPLDFCIADADDMQQLAASRGFESNRLVDAEATRDAVVAEVQRAAKSLGDGDIFLFTYAGHGGQLPDLNLDEDHGPDGDTLDETLCLYDGQLIDDELYRLWAEFEEGVRVVTVFDCCHSGSVVRAQPRLVPESTPGTNGSGGGSPGGKVRVMPLSRSAAVYRRNADFYRSVAVGLSSPNSAVVREVDYPVRATVIQLSACQSNQVARESLGNGLFTERMLATLDSGGWSGYPDFLDATTARMPSSQTPKYWMVGSDDPVFEASQPFVI